jgi:hypothetical protein
VPNVPRADECSVPGCPKAPRLHGLCTMHYQRWLKTGDPGEAAPRRVVSYGGVHRPTFNSWRDMVRRCTNPARKDYPRYGGRGIRVCDRWLDYRNFLADMGERPPGRTLERVDNEGHYEPGNCCWATREEQARNTRKALSPACPNGHRYTPETMVRDRRGNRSCLRCRRAARARYRERRKAAQGAGI